MMHYRNPKDRPLPASHARANAARSAVEHVFISQNYFIGQKYPMKLFVRTVALARAKA